MLSSFVCDTSFRFYESKYQLLKRWNNFNGLVINKEIMCCMASIFKNHYLSFITSSLKPHVSQYNCISFNTDCSVCGFCEITKFEVADLYRINDLTAAEYIDLIAWKNLVLMLSAKIFCHKYILSILSNILPSQERQHKGFFSYLPEF